MHIRRCACAVKHSSCFRFGNHSGGIPEVTTPIMNGLVQSQAGGGYPDRVVIAKPLNASVRMPGCES